MLSKNTQNKLPVYILTFCLSILSLVIGFKINLLKVEAAYTSSINIPSSYVNIGEPHGMAMAADGNIWYVDTANVRLVKYNPDTNAIVRTVGRDGPGEGEFDAGIYDLAQDNQGYLYVLSTWGHVYKLDPNGGFMAFYDLAGLPDNNNLATPRGITYDSHSNSILIVNRDKQRVEEFTTDMEFVSYISSTDGTSGNGNLEFNNPWGITTDASGKIYVADEFNNRVQIFNADHSYLDTIDTYLDGDGNPQPFPLLGYNSAIKDILILGNGDIIVANQNWNRIIRYNSDREFLGIFGINDGDNNTRGPEYMVKDSSNNIYIADHDQKSVKKYNSTGVLQTLLTNYSVSTDGKLAHPIGVAYDSFGNMYVLDTGRVLEFSNAGAFIGVIIPSGLGSNPIENIAIDSSDRIYIANLDGVLQFTNVEGTWTHTATVGSYGTDPGQFISARGLSFDSTGNLYVTDYDNARIQKFNTSLEYVSGFSIPFTFDPENGNHTSGPRGVVVDSAGYIYVADERSLTKYDSDNVSSPLELGTGAAPTALSIDRTVSPNLIYLTEQHGAKVSIYNSDQNTEDEGPIESFGTSGGGQVQFNTEPWGNAVNPLDHTITVCDFYGSRVESLTQGNFRILNLISSANVISLDSGVSNGKSISDNAWAITSFTDAHNIPARMTFGDYVVADLTVDLTEDRDWSDVNVLTLPIDSKSLLVDLGSAPGIVGTHSLYLARYSNQTTVTVCPDATEWADLTANCTDVALLVEGDNEHNRFPLTAIVNLNGENYWRIDGLSGTGAFSSLFETGFSLSDSMTRQQISTASNHEISFGTSYDINNIGDTITLSFADGFDVQTDLTISNLSLYDWTNVRDLPLSDTASDNTWTVSLNANPNEIVFTAPQNADVSEQVILTGSVIKLFINNNALINPDTPGSYQIGMRILTDDGTDQTSESGSVNVAIVDSDQVNIAGYVNSFMSFDIDTGVLSDSECASNSCVLHGGTSVMADNYTVDLGELKSTDINKSNDAEVMHSDGKSGVINSIYFDLSTNAQNGAVVTVASATDDGLVGPDGSNITPITDGTTIEENSGKYGFNVSDSSSVDGEGVATNSECNIDDTTLYCGSVMDPKLVFNTSGSPIDTARVRMDIAAAATYTNVPGAYEDTLTFVATAEF